MYYKINKIRQKPLPFLKRKGGFTLVELMVSVSIFTLITSIVLFKHSEFSANVTVENLAYDIALSVRKAQVFGLSIREGVSDDFAAGYGIHFSTPNSYFLFLDTNKNGAYTIGDTIVEKFNLRSNYIISDFCAGNTVTDLDCSLTELDVMFNRPDPDAIIIKNSDPLQAPVSFGMVTVQSPRGVEWKVAMTATGQISVEE